jgi:hypothetical protein
MRKLKLDLTALRVESFELRKAPAQGEGTVHGHFQRIEPQPDTYRDTECLGTMYTWNASCPYSCFDSCTCMTGCGTCDYTCATCPEGCV